MPRSSPFAIDLRHLPVHASWLNQIEIYFSVVQRKVLTPNDYSSLAEVKDRLLAFQERYECIAQPFEWRFTRTDLANLLARLNAGPAGLSHAAQTLGQEYVTEIPKWST